MNGEWSIGEWECQELKGMSQERLSAFNDLCMEEPNEPYGSISSYRDLVVWQHSMDVAEMVYEFAALLPNEERFGLMSQMCRASVSMPANIAEGWGRNRTGYLNLGLSYSRGSIHEVESQLLNCIDVGFLSKEDTDPVMDLIMRCSSGLLNFMSKLEITR